MREADRKMSGVKGPGGRAACGVVEVGGMVVEGSGVAGGIVEWQGLQ